MITYQYLLLLCFVCLNSYAKCKNKINNHSVWKETFNIKTDSLNTQKWSYHHKSRFLVEAPFDRGYKKFVFTDGDKLHLKADRVDGQLFLPMVSTLNKYHFLYGKLSIKAKCPIGKGVWPAIWLVPCKIDSMNYGEIDIQEYIHCFEGKSYQANVHFVTRQNGKEIRKMSQKRIDTDADRWHIYTLEWYPETIIFKLDEKEVYRVAKATHELWPYDQEYYLIFDVLFGGGWGASCGTDNNALPAEMLVDWVKYYPLKK